MQNERFQRALAIRRLAGSTSAAQACAEPETGNALIGDLRLFALTFAGGFLFTSIFIA